METATLSADFSAGDLTPPTATGDEARGHGDHGDHGDGDAGAGPLVRLTLGSVKGLTAVLQAVKPGAKQACSVSVAPDGLSLRWEDDSKTLQSSVFLRADVSGKGHGGRVFFVGWR